MDFSPGSEEPNTFRAAKVLSSSATKLHLQGITLELSAWQRVDESARGFCTLPLLHHFLQEADDDGGGPHLCLIMPVNSIDMGKFRRTLDEAKGRMPPWMLKPLMGNVLEGLTDMHAAGVIHAGRTTNDAASFHQ